MRRQPMGQTTCNPTVPKDSASEEITWVTPLAELVMLHIYDVSGDTRVQLVNELFRPVGAGAFHAGVEIYGQEWSFGGREDNDAGTGVFCCEPRESPVHRYRETVTMTTTDLQTQEVVELIDQLKAEWPGRSYDLVSRNCCHFCDALCRALGAGPLPAWVTNLAGTSAALLSGVQAMQDSIVIQAVREAWNSIDVEIECVRASGVDIASLRPEERRISMRLTPGRPEPVGPRQQPEAFVRLVPPDVVGLPLATLAWLHDHLFSVGWQPPCLYVRKPAPEAPVVVNGRPVKQLTYVLLSNAEIGLIGAEGGVPLLAFRVLRSSAAKQVKRLLMSEWR